MASSSKDNVLKASLALVPAATRTATTMSMAGTSHPDHANIHDSMRHGGPRSLAYENSSATQHPLQNRLEMWDETRDNFKLTVMRNTFGIGAPMRVMMEREAVSHNPLYSSPNSITGLHMDILNGEDETLNPTDFMRSEAARDQLDFHTEMERKYRI
ncbi:hypothetical protein CF319_g4166 [Tilletia indica]|uniref:Proteasome maturation factor UMP1 n=2 Tax=Tilletia TaxID=13289 RepID=A0A8X7N9B5_9BASI|nr:hypothetical protein CF327_g2780 [Tilletia walkeri]KAE8222674.1 hypothetical protein CF319_g4166 [Tilletia indica]KAE8231323.1 hypothetical protein CF326_g3664 [Tilletia indica]KAE8257471.1 hypothetical protein A4X13_0g2334 [Tilletia indica]KAE8268877.1 hypothetical protein A4X09_0g3451 [Tilletia walkeri]